MVPEPSGRVVDVPRSGVAVPVLMDHRDTAAVREGLKGRAHRERVGPQHPSTVIYMATQGTHKYLRLGRVWMPMCVACGVRALSCPCAT